MRLFLNSLAASAGGGLTYIRNVIPFLAGTPDLQVIVALTPGLRAELQNFKNVDFVELDIPPARRFWYEQSTLPSVVRHHAADVLLSAGNFALRNSPVPQILLSRNSVYTSADFFRDLRSRHEYRSWLDTHLRAWLAKKSIQWADITVAPSAAFAGELHRWTGKPIQAIHHGFDLDAFCRDSGPLSEEVERKLRTIEGSLKLLFVSHYNYYRNFETLLHALPLLRDLLPGRSVKLLLTCRLVDGENPGAYRPKGAASLVKKLGISDLVVELGAVPYRQLHRLYRRAEVYVTPAYTETFAHPLVEAMASGLPVVASDIAVHQEICGEAAVYFPRFSSAQLADRVAQIATEPEMPTRMARVGLERSRHFSWKTHVEKILELARLLQRNDHASGLPSSDHELKDYAGTGPGAGNGTASALSSSPKLGLGSAQNA
jgi:glycosyltransferase involved in cell wall biosynthesis